MDGSPQVANAALAPAPDPPILLSSLRATTGHRRLALRVSLGLAAALAICVPVAQMPLAPSPAFIAFQQAVLLANDLITAALLFAQYSVQPSRALKLLAAGYLFTALIVIPHALVYPGLISPTGLFGAGPQSAAWLYVAWRTVLPSTVIAYALRREGVPADQDPAGARARIVGAAAVAAAAVVVLALIATIGQDRLPLLMDGNHFGPGARVAVPTMLILDLAALLAILRRPSHSILDSWLMVVMFAWFCADLVGSLISAGRYDVGYYAGRLYSILASTFVLLVLLYEMTALYARVMHTARTERRERERRLKEMEAVLVEAERAEQLMLTAKRAAEDANQTKSEFLAGMSHEIRTPMTCVLGMADLLVESELTARQRRHVTLLRDAGHLLLAIIDDLLDISKIEAGKLELARMALSPAAVAEGAVAIVRPGAVARGLQLRCELGADLPAWIEGDATRLRQVLLNLLSNAVKFTERGSVSLRVACVRGAETQQLRFEVADTGIGIDDAQQHLLFQRFSQVGPSIYRRFGGTGLGLAISRHLVEAMGGMIGVDSRIGAGSTFWFAIPYVETAVQTAPEMRQPTGDAGPRARVLVAEDQDMIRELIEAMLSDAGHEVVLVRDGAEAIAALTGSDFDVVLMDIQMPGLDGIAATRQIREMGDRIRGIPIIALTAYAMAEDRERCRAAGANAHLSKPIDRKELLRLIAKWSGKGRGPGPSPSRRTATPPVIEISVLNGLESRLGKARVAAFARQFRDQVGQALGVITAAADRRRIAEETHDLLSLAGTLGCVELMNSSRSLMEAARRETSDLAPLVAELAAAAGRALSAMRERYPALERLSS
jgi:signal transduction histidine kinase/DNA-binding response OmpR family regulator